MKTKTDILKLPKAPLQEVIFEVRWDLDVNLPSQQEYDAEIETAVGTLKTLLMDQFPLFQRKLPPELPVQFLNNQIVYQYWTDKNTWPLMQLGPGVFTVNDTDKEYEWSGKFYPLIKSGLEALIQSYSKEPSFRMASLRYIDVVRVNDYKFDSWENFIQKNLNFKFENMFDTRGKLKQFTLTQVFETKEADDLHITISNGKNAKKEDILIWETNLINVRSFNKEELLDWADQAHAISSELFEEICQKGFYGSFNK